MPENNCNQKGVENSFNFREKNVFFSFFYIQWMRNWSVNVPICKSVQTDLMAPVIHVECVNHANQIHYLHDDGRKMDRVEMSDYKNLPIFAPISCVSVLKWR